jgi:serine/threonine-protein kinase
MLFLLAKQLGLGDGSDTGALITVPKVINEQEADAKGTLEQLGFEVTVTREPNDEFDAGIVFAQDPANGTKVERGTPIKLKVSEGAEAVEVPGVLGLTQEQADAALRAEGFDVRVEPSPDEDAEEGTVTDQDPDPHADAPKGSTVTIFVASGPAAVNVRDVTDRTEGDASALLQGDGFKVSSTDEASSTVKKGRVIRTEPPAGSSRPVGSTITIVVSTGPDVEQVTVPNTVGQTEGAARAILEGQGFTVNVQDELVANPLQEGRVIDQEPANGKADKGSTVTIFVGTTTGGD